MVACDEFARGRPDVVRRAAVGAPGEACRSPSSSWSAATRGWIAEGARLAQPPGPRSSTSTSAARPRKSPASQSGSALMREPDLAESLVKAAVDAVDVPVTVKMRLGWDDNSATPPNWPRRFEAAGAKALTIHGRTRCQFYTGQADWSAVRAVKDGRLDPGGRQRRRRRPGQRPRGARRSRAPTR
jgi:tRNA-dihydrouridine synthase B